MDGRRAKTSTKRNIKINQMNQLESMTIVATLIDWNDVDGTKNLNALLSERNQIEDFYSRRKKILENGKKVFRIDPITPCHPDFCV